MARQIIHHHDVAGTQCGNQVLLDPAEEQLPVDRPLHAQRGDEAGRAHRAEKRRRFPAAVGHGLDESCSLEAAAVSARHVGLGPGLIQKDDLIGIELRLLFNPLTTLVGDVVALLLGRNQRLFFA